MKRILSLLFFVTLITGCSVVQPPRQLSAPMTAAEPEHFGIDALALAKIDARAMAAELPQGWYAGYLDGTFGDPYPNLEVLSPKLGGFRGHGIDATCWRNRNCERGAPPLSDYATLAKRAAKAEAFKRQHPNLECLYSPWLEYDEKDRAKVQKAVDTVRKNAPSCQVVLSPVSGVTVPGTLIEKHGNSARANVISNDGNNLFDSNSPSYRTGGDKLTLGWFPRLNLRVSGEKTFTPPSRRKSRPTRDNFKQAVRVLRAQPAKPTGKPSACKTVRELTGKELWKTNAEDYDNGDVRGDKPLLISKSRSSQMDVLAPDGRKVGCIKYYGPYEPGYYRHYAGSCSRDSGVTLMDKAKSEWIFLNDRGNCLLVNAIRRKGYYK